MEKQGYGPNRQLKVKLATRGIALCRAGHAVAEPAARYRYRCRPRIAETSLWFARLGRKDYAGLERHRQRVDDPDQTFFENCLRVGAQPQTAIPRSRS
jgi:peptide/nickel transport system substrate-binding protein